MYTWTEDNGMKVDPATSSSSTTVSTQRRHTETGDRICRSLQNVCVRTSFVRENVTCHTVRISSSDLIVCISTIRRPTI